jgi:hypothetical protein
MRGAEYSKKTPNIFLNLCIESCSLPQRCSHHQDKVQKRVPFLEAYLQKAYLQAEGKALMPKAGNGSATERKQL